MNRFIVSSVNVTKGLYALVNLIQFFIGIFVLEYFIFHFVPPGGIFTMSLFVYKKYIKKFLVNQIYFLIFVL